MRRRLRVLPCSAVAREEQENAHGGQHPPSTRDPSAGNVRPRDKNREVHMKTSLLAFGAAAACGVLLVSPAMAQKKYGPGVSDTEIVLGQTIAYSGPASAY